MPAQLIQALFAHLPCFAEEEGDHDIVKRSDLIGALCREQQIDPVVAENTVNLCETLLDTLATLKTDNLQRGEWCFVSFPAQLLAMSILTAMSDTDSRLFADNFWNTQGIADDKKDRQREVLRAIEQARHQHHARRQAQPIRYCYVAWSIVKLGGSILFYQREDTQKRFDQSAGDYGLIGGRANQNDVHGITNKTELLKTLQSPNSPIIKKALPETLKRELREEAGLQFQTHYTFKPWRTLKPFRQVQGAAPNHALTEYYLAIFYVELTLDGYLFLRRKVDSDARLVWFSIADIADGGAVDGKIPYIKALYADYAGDRATLSADLSELPGSFAPGYVLNKEKFGITLPIDPGKPVAAGLLGKEKPLALTLSTRQLALFLGLAAHLRGFEFTKLTEDPVLHLHGWVEITEASPMRAELIELAALSNGSDWFIENHKDKLFRLSMTPLSVFFADELFSFMVASGDLNGVSSKLPVTILRQSFDTAFGHVGEKSESFKISLELAHRLKSLTQNQFSVDNDLAIKTEDAYKKGLHKDPRFQALGLRNLVRRDAGIVKFAVRYLG